MVAEGPATRLDRGGREQGRYSLATAMLIVRELDSSAVRAAVFEEIKRKNPFYRLVDALYRLAGSRLIQPFILWVYMLKSVLSVGPFRDGSERVVALATFPNEQHTIARVEALAPDVDVLRLSIQRGHIFGRGQLRASMRMIGAFARLWPFLRRIARTHSFMPAGRIVSTLAFYMRFVQFLDEHPNIDAAIIASNHGPEGLGLAAATHQAGKRLVFANHAPIPENGAVIPPVYSDCALFYGEETAATYKRRSACTAEVVLIGQPGPSKPMGWRNGLEKVGIFLTAGTRVDVLSSLITDIRRTHPKVDILVRDHPVALLRNNLSDFVTGDPKVELTIGNPLDEEIADCDLIVCGNSGVALNALSGGRPVAYRGDLDGNMFDYAGFVANGLVAHEPEWSDDIYARMKAFYNSSDWPAIMRRYDASYGADVDALTRDAATILARHLGPGPTRMVSQAFTDR